MISEANELVEIIKSLNESLEDEFFDICFSDPIAIDRNAVVQFLTDRVNESATHLDKDELRNYLLKMKSDDILFYSFFEDLYNGLPCRVERLPKFHWMLMSIAMKKCLGEENARKQITDFKLYIGLFDDVTTAQQESTHKNCIGFFNTDVGKFSVGNVGDLALYLHCFRSKNKRIKTRKKNLRRVTRATKKIMLSYKIARNGRRDDLLSHGRHKVPDQVRNRLVRLFLS